MLRLYVIREQLNDLEGVILAPRALTDSEMERVHDACRKALEGVERGLSTRAELYTLYYLCQPLNLFRRVTKNDRTVKRYARLYLGMDTRLLSYYRSPLAFLYFNDPSFRKVAARAAEAAVGALRDAGEEEERPP
jgi:hypothetical protein